MPSESPQWLHSHPAAVTQSQYNLANYNIGYAKFKSEDYAAAQTAFRKYVKEKSQTDNARYTDALLRIADCFFMLKDQASAIDFLQSGDWSNAKSQWLRNLSKGVILGIQGRMAEKSCHTSKAFDKYPKSVYYDDALYEAAQASLIIGNNEQALNYYQKLSAIILRKLYEKAELGEALVYYNEKKTIKRWLPIKR